MDEAVVPAHAEGDGVHGVIEAEHLAGGDAGDMAAGGGNGTLIFEIVRAVRGQLERGEGLGGPVGTGLAAEAEEAFFVGDAGLVDEPVVVG